MNYENYITDDYIVSSLENDVFEINIRTRQIYYIQ